MSKIYNEAREFIQDQVRYLTQPFSFTPAIEHAIENDQRHLQQLEVETPVQETNSGNDGKDNYDDSDSDDNEFKPTIKRRRKELDKAGLRKKPTGKYKRSILTKSYVQKVLDAANTQMRKYYSRLFTRQSINHLAMQIQSSEHQRYMNAARLSQQVQRLGDPVWNMYLSKNGSNPGTNSLEEEVAYNTNGIKIALGGLTSEQRLKLAQDLCDLHPDKPTGSRALDLTIALAKYQRARAQHDQYRTLQEWLTSVLGTGTLGDSSKENIELNLPNRHNKALLKKLNQLKVLQHNLKRKNKSLTTNKNLKPVANRKDTMRSFEDKFNDLYGNSDIV
ncbi:hypothetical protein NADFUDRAFT_41375 [Nadsonia fulvescens var. elongata DSM 6958]|uniref:Uncharacterized protein n=1 Tax=Nadsonia fulvescens var. elongata DSM 6958 TaxID=857566 RepID=A0A1E3PPA5_9ASCO|nr:hypothetical protein NADFUDRAFT_41375 [Nadsonia fulvescens var. elongata DSM 6958]